MYSQKIIQDLKPQWYLDLSKSEKLKEQSDLKERHNELWNNKPTLLRSGTILKSKITNNSLTKDKSYIVRGHFCTLVTTIYDSNWNQFVIIKNDGGWTVKMNLNNFEKL